MHVLARINLLSMKKKKSHTCEEGGIPQNFCLAFVGELEKQLLKKLLKWANKKCKNFNIYNVDLKKQTKKNTRRCHYFTHVYQKS